MAARPGRTAAVYAFLIAAALAAPDKPDAPIVPPGAKLE
jgi:hypothetical protein